VAFLFQFKEARTWGFTGTMKSKHDFPSMNEKSAEGLKPTGIPYRVMVVEDQDFQRKQIRQILESEKYDVVADVRNGKEALDAFDKIGETKLDLIVTDLDMPILDGYALLFELKKNRNVKTKFVFVSDETTKGVLQDILQMGASDFILKPIQRIRLLDRIKLVLSR
jgi:two-component system, chemotaxis family, chemotaxis protein CheY